MGTHSSNPRLRRFGLKNGSSTMAAGMDQKRGEALSKFGRIWSVYSYDPITGKERRLQKRQILGPASMLTKTDAMKMLAKLIEQTSAASAAKRPSESNE
jgi:hypothetical protein